MKNIILIGFMGSGKTTVGRRLSYRIKRTMIDTDKQIEKEQEMSVAQIFREKGESHFRDLETECLRNLIQAGRSEIISTGGGIPLRPENRDYLKTLGTVIFLKVTANTILERLEHDMTRPLLQGENPRSKIEEMLLLRNPSYLDAADLIIEVDGKSFDMILDEIEEALRANETFSDKWT